MANYVFGVDIGGTTVKIGLFTTQGEMVEKWEITTRTDEGGKCSRCWNGCSGSGKGRRNCY